MYDLLVYTRHYAFKTPWKYPLNINKETILLNYSDVTYFYLLKNSRVYLVLFKTPMNKFDDRKTESKLVKEINTECFHQLALQN